MKVANHHIWKLVYHFGMTVSMTIGIPLYPQYTTLDNTNRDIQGNTLNFCSPPNRLIFPDFRVGKNKKRT